MNIAAKIDVINNFSLSRTIDPESFIKKYNLIHEILDEIDTSDFNQVEKEHFLKVIFKSIFAFGYEIAYNKTFEYSLARYHQELVFKIFLMSKAIFHSDPKSQIPFYTEKLQYIYTEPERSNLQQELAKINAVA